MRIVRTSVYFVSLTVLLLSVPLPSWAATVTLPATQFGGTVGAYALCCGVPNSPIAVSGPGTVTQSQTDPYGQVSTSTMIISTGPAPSVSVTGSVSSVAINTSGGGTNSYSPLGSLGPATSFGDDLQGIVYSMLITGPTATVPILVNSTVQASLGPNPTIIPGENQLSEATFSISHGQVYPGNPNYSFLDFGSNVMLNGGGGAGFNTTTLYNQGYAVYTNIAVTPATGMSGTVSGSQVWMAHTGVVYSVQLGVFEAISMSGNLGQYGTITVSASVDPTFQIASGVPNANAYSIDFSSGIGNGAPVPEPATLGLMGIGLAGMRLVRRRQKS